MKQNSPTNYGFKPLEKNISQILKPVFAKKKDDFLVINHLNKNWQQIAGEKCWQFCFPRKIKFEKNKKVNGVLTIVAHNSSIAFYLEASSGQIIENIAAYYGYKVVGEIRIVQEPKILEVEQKKSDAKISAVKEEFIAKSTTTIQDDELKSILQKLGKLILE